jgi:hypothetical protein
VRGSFFIPTGSEKRIVDGRKAERKGGGPVEFIGRGRFDLIT